MTNKAVGSYTLVSPKVVTETKLTKPKMVTELGDCREEGGAWRAELRSARDIFPVGLSHYFLLLLSILRFALPSSSYDYDTCPCTGRPWREIENRSSVRPVSSTLSM
jgi:hypothetical protein